MKTVIAFRPANWPFAQPFYDAVKRFKTTESDLARLAIEKGLELATRELAQKRKAEEKAIASLKRQANGPFEMGRSSGCLIAVGG